MELEPEGAGERNRLEPRDPAPWRRQAEKAPVFLYWLPVRSFPLRMAERNWLMEFLDRWQERVAQGLGLRTEVFLDGAVALDCREVLQRTATEFYPSQGLSRQPGAPLRPLAIPAETPAGAEGKKEFDMRGAFSGYCYWFVRKAEKKLRELFLGHGGLTLIFLAPDPATKPLELPFGPRFRQKNPVFQKLDVDGLLSVAFSLKDRFLPLSKQVFGKGLEDDPQFQAMNFVLPPLSTSDFFTRPAEEVATWFQVFDIYLRESPPDEGVLLASKIDLEEHLVALVASMREDGWEYPEG